MSKLLNNKHTQTNQPKNKKDTQSQFNDYLLENPLQ